MWENDINLGVFVCALDDIVGRGIKVNIKMLIQRIKDRPQMFVGEIGELSLEILSSFIRGFLYSNINANRAETIDSTFMYEFHSWVKDKLEKSRNVDLGSGRNYVFYLSEVYEEPKEQLDAFFELCEEFFEEVEKGNVKLRFS